jgi:stage II sporulation protein AA (anti-sigma F factor antagonist)
VVQLLHHAFFVIDPNATENVKKLFYTEREISKGGYKMQFTSYLENGRLTIALTGEIDHHCARNYIQAIAAKIEAYTPDICVLDFREVTFIDSSGIAVVINALRNMSQIEGKLELSSLGAQPMRVLRASGIDKIVEIKEAVS